MLRISLALEEGRSPRLTDAFSDFNLAPGFLAGQLLYLAIVLAGLALCLSGSWLRAVTPGRPGALAPTP